MDFVAFAKDERGHLRVPEAGLMSKMDTRLQHLSHGHAGHVSLLFGLGLRASLVATLDVQPQRLNLRLRHPATRLSRCACGVTLPKKAALYSMPVETEQCLTL